MIEMLIVIGIIAVLSALILPALQGLVGASGLRGGVNTVLATLNHARAAAIENGTDVYVGFPPASFSNSADPDIAYASIIVFRAATLDEPGGTIKPLSRWQRLPKGVFLQIQTNSISVSNLSSSPAASLPKLAGQEVNPRVIRYDRFGRIRATVSGGTNIIVGEGIRDGATIRWKSNNREFLTAQRLTGRWIVSR